MPSISTAQHRGNYSHADDESASTVEAAENMRQLHEAVFGLRLRQPELSAATGLWAWQRRALIAAVLALGTGVVLAPETTLIALLAVMAVPFLCVVVLRTVALRQLRAPLRTVAPSARVPDDQLPMYTCYGVV